MTPKLMKTFLAALSLAGLLGFTPLVWAHDEWDHQRLHEDLNNEHQELHDEMGELHRDFHSHPHSAWEHRRLHEDLERLHRDAHQGLADEHHAYHDPEGDDDRPYYEDDERGRYGRYYGDEAWRSYNPYNWYQG